MKIYQMVKLDVPFDRTFHALADPTRRAIVEQLSHSERSLGELARPFAMTLPAVYKHLRILEEAGIVSSRREGRQRRCRLQTRPLEDAAGWIQRRRTLWSRRLRSLHAHIEQERT